jgi:hypothetical protein
MFEKINLFYFIISFCIGLILVNLIKPKPEVIFKFPTKYNAGKVIYEDNSGNCYKYNYEENKCPVDKTLIKEHPIESFKN